MFDKLKKFLNDRNYVPVVTTEQHLNYVRNVVRQGGDYEYSVEQFTDYRGFNHRAHSSSLEPIYRADYSRIAKLVGVEAGLIETNLSLFDTHDLFVDLQQFIERKLELPPTVTPKPDVQAELPTWDIGDFKM